MRLLPLFLFVSTSLVVLGLKSSLAASKTVAKKFELACPHKITTKQKLQNKIDGFKAISSFDSGQNYFKALFYYDGNPKDGAM